MSDEPTTDMELAERFDWSGPRRDPGELLRAAFGDEPVFTRTVGWVPAGEAEYIPCDHVEGRTIEGEWLVTRCAHCSNEVRVHRAVYEDWARLGPG